MPLEIGSITVAENGEVSGSGLALAIFEGALSGASTEARASVAASMKSFAEGVAAAIVNHFEENGLVVVQVDTGGLQRTPNPNNPETATLGPAAPVTLNGTIT